MAAVQSLGWDEKYYGLQMEPHLRATTPLVLPAYAFHINIWIPDDRSEEIGQTLLDKFKHLKTFGAVTLKDNDLASDEAYSKEDYFLNNAAWDWELNNPELGLPLIVCRFEIHKEYSSITLFIPWRGRKTTNHFNDAFWGFKNKLEQQDINALYDKGQAACRDFLKRCLFLESDFLAQESPAASDYQVFGAFEGLAVPEQVVWPGRAFLPPRSKPSGDQGELFAASSVGDGESLKEESNARYSLDLVQTEALLAKIHAIDRPGERGWRTRIACGMLKGQALYTSTIGYQKGADRLSTLRYMLLYSNELAPQKAELQSETDRFNWPLSRLIHRLHEIGTRRLAALKDIDRVWLVGTKLKNLEFDAEKIPFGSRTLDVDTDKQLRKVLQGVHNLPVEFRSGGGKPNASQNLYYRLGRSREYAAAVRTLTRDLGVVTLATYQDYDQFIRRRLYNRFGYIERFGARLEQLHERMRSLMEYRLSERAGTLTWTAHVVGSVIFGVQLTEFAMSLLDEAWITSIGAWPEAGIRCSALAVFTAAFWGLFRFVVGKRFAQREKDV